MGTSPSETVLATSCGSVPQSLPAFQHPSHALLKENNFTQQAYHKYRQRCLKGKINTNTLRSFNLTLLNSVYRF